MAGVAIQKSRYGAAPTIMVADGKHDQVRYSFSPQTGFTEVFRSTDTARTFTTPPVALPNRTALVGASDGLLTQTGPTYSYGYAGLGASGPLTAAPTRMHDGTLAVVSRAGWLTLLNGSGSIIYRDKLTGGESIASAAASCKHLFVSTEGELVTYDVTTGLAAARYYWQKPYVEGGLHAPVIGPTGYVYVIGRFSLAKSEALFVFPRPANGGVGSPTGCTTGWPF